MRKHRQCAWAKFALMCAVHMTEARASRLKSVVLTMPVYLLTPPLSSFEPRSRRLVAISSESRTARCKSATYYWHLSHLSCSNRALCRTHKNIDDGMIQILCPQRTRSCGCSQSESARASSSYVHLRRHRTPYTTGYPLERF